MKVGDVVGCAWVGHSCGHCQRCISGEENLCDTGYTPLYVGRHGGFAEYIQLNSKYAFKIPEKIKQEDAGPLLCAGLTL